jgi:hypothetical protein
MNRQQHNRSHHETPERDDMGRFTSDRENVSRERDRDYNGYPHGHSDNDDDYDQRGRGLTHRRGPNYGFASDEEGARGGRMSEGSGGDNRDRDEHGRFASENSGSRSSREGAGSRTLDWNQHSHERGSGKGPHRGKGPKGYRRSDERIEEEVNQALSDDDQLDASSIEVKVKAGDVTLTGTVSSREDKRRAEDCIESISGVNNVENLIRVNRNADSSPEQQKNSKEQESENKSKSKQASHANA